MNIIFVGGLFPRDFYSKYIDSISNGLQVASENFQASFIDGLLSNQYKIKIISAPFFPYCSKDSKIMYIEGGVWKYKENDFYGVSYLNIPFIKNQLKIKGLKNYIKKSLSGDCQNIIFVYSANYAYLKAALEFEGQATIVPIITDLPKHVSSSNFVYNKYISIFENNFFKKNINKFDGYVFLTKYVADYLKLDPSKCFVMEGIYTPIKIDNSEKIKKEKNVVLYTGTLKDVYGVKDLIECFKSIEHYELWICGDGELKNYIIECGIKYKNIKYLGMLNKAEIIKIQKTASILINPRKNEHELNMYTFPSKTMEYLASGTPVLMYNLSGIPDEYHKYLNFIDPQISLKDNIINFFERDLNKLNETANAARSFILNDKNSTRQIYELMDFVVNKLI